MRPSALKDALLFHATLRQPCGVVGQPGVGKSEIMLAVAREAGFAPEQIFVLNAANRDPTDFSGLPSFAEADGRKVVEWAKAKMFFAKQPIFIFLDELFQAPVQTQNVVAPIILENRVDDVYLPEGSWVAFASNRAQDKAGTNRVPSHIPNRVTLYEGPDVDPDDWSIWALDNNIDVRVIQFIRMKGTKALSDFNPSELINATPRQWAWVGRYLEQMPEAIRFETVEGRVGKGLAAELMGFIKIADELPPKEKILLDPKKTKVPTEPSALYLVTGMLAQCASRDNFDAICTYMERVPPEFQAMCVKDAMRQHPEVTSTKAFVTWGVKFASVLR
jgi:hypothetical protein